MRRLLGRGKKPGSNLVPAAVLVLVILTVTVGSYFSIAAQVSSAGPSPSSGSTSVDIPQTSLTATTFDVRLVNASVTLARGSTTTLVFQISSPISGTFFTGLINQADPDAIVLGGASPIALQNGMAAEFPQGKTVSGLNPSVFVTLKEGTDSSVARTGSFQYKFVVFEKEPGGTYLGQDLVIFVGVT